MSDADDRLQAALAAMDVASGEAKFLVDHNINEPTDSWTVRWAKDRIRLVALHRATIERHSIDGYNGNPLDDEHDCGCWFGWPYSPHSETPDTCIEVDVIIDHWLHP